MIKKVLILTIFFLSISVISCTDARTEILKNITYDVRKSTVIFPYEDYDITIGSTPLFIRELTPINNSEGLYGYINQQAELVIDYQFTKAYNFNKYGYALVQDGEGSNMIDTQGVKVFEEDLEGWYYSGYTDSYIKFNNSSSEDDFEVVIYNYDGELLKGYTAANQYDAYNEYPTISARTYASSNDFGAYYQPLIDSDGNLLDNDDLNNIDYSYRNMISAATERPFNSNSRFGAFTAEGVMVAPFEYIYEIEFGSLWQFSDLATIMTTDGLYGFIDYTGEIVIEPRYQSSLNEETDKYYNKSYQYLFNEGVEVVTDHGKGLVIDYLGNVLFEANENQKILDCNSELIAVRNYYEIDEEDYYVVDVFDYNGNIVYRNESDVDIAFTQDDSDIFFVTSLKSEYYSEISDKVYTHSGELLLEGIKVFQNPFNDIYTSFVNGALVVKDLETDKWGFINELGEWIIEPEFDDPRGVWYDNNNYIFYSDGYAVVCKGDKYGVIDKQGNYVIDFVLKESPYDILDFVYVMLLPEDQQDLF